MKKAKGADGSASYWKWFIGPTTDHKILRALLCSIFEVSIAPVNSCGCSQIWISSNKRKWNIIILLYRRSVRTQRPIEVGDRICWKGIVKSCSWIAWPGLFDMRCALEFPNEPPTTPTDPSAPLNRPPRLFKRLTCRRWQITCHLTSCFLIARTDRFRHGPVPFPKLSASIPFNHFERKQKKSHKSAYWSASKRSGFW